MFSAGLDAPGEGGLPLRQAMLDHFRASGLAEVVGTALPDNVRMLALARASGFEVTRDDDVVRLRLVLRPETAQGHEAPGPA
ncbi:hypothetical protein [Massilia sp. METH4]|uniref:hypothetical protein n=1 Tax=Massilia sp. METH4 TaxID=3123041 RepID=UPI0030CD3EF9